MAEDIRIEVAYGTSEKQVVVPLTVAVGTTVLQAAELADLDVHFPGINWRELPKGIFGRRVDDDDLVSQGDRVELYRTLVASPQETRRKRARGDG